MKNLPHELKSVMPPYSTRNVACGRLQRFSLPVLVLILWSLFNAVWTQLNIINLSKFGPTESVDHRSDNFLTLDEERKENHDKNDSDAENDIETDSSFKIIFAEKDALSANVEEKLANCTDRSLQNSFNDEKLVVAILVATKSSKEWTDVSSTTMQTKLVKSLNRSITERELDTWSIRLYLGMDDDDYFWQDHVSGIQTPKWMDVRPFFFPKSEKNRIPFNELAAKAYEEGCEYFVRVNDDTEFITSSWITYGVRTLQSYAPPNVGVVGPSCDQGNTNIMTHDMVHRTHMDIFNQKYYPTRFQNWFIDDWITRVYSSRNLGQQNRSEQLKEWVVVHHLSTTRYNPDTSLQMYLNLELNDGKIKILDYIHNKKDRSNSNWTIMITVNDGYFDFFHNWWLYYVKLDLSLPIIILAEDDEVFSRLKTLDLPNATVQRSALTSVRSKDHNYETPEYLKMVSNRATYIIDFLCSNAYNGGGVIYTDIDTIWLKDPMPYITGFENDKDGSDYDIILQIDNENYNNYKPYYCTGFMAIHSNQRTLELMKKWERLLLNSSQLNQPIFNKLVHESSNVKHGGLSESLFSSGKVYFETMRSNAEREKVVLVHNNFVIGHDVKKKRFIDHNLWISDL